MTDQEIIEEVRSGKNNAFEELVKRYEPRVAATIIGMLGKCQETDDVGQETFIRFYKGLDKFRGEASLGTYLTRIAINLSLNEIKRRKRRSMFFMNSNDEKLKLINNNPHEYNDEKEFVHRAIQQLPQRCRSVIVLRLMDGYSTEETAKILKIPIGTVLSRLARAQQKLKSMLSSYQGGLR